MPAEIPSGVTLTYSQQYRRCGKPGCPICVAGGQGHGPYWYVYWREGKRTRSRYLGKQPPAEVAPGEAVEPSSTRTAQPSAPQPGSDLRVRMLGGFELRRGGERLATERWERRQEGVLLKWLLGTPGHRLARDEVLERFWPEAMPARGTANLRVLAHRLRRALGDAEGACTLRYDGEMLALALGPAGCLDADAFAQAARTALAGRDAGACRAALARYTGEYLPEDTYEEWALGRREEPRQQRVAVLLLLSACPGLRILATSRTALGVSGEYRWPVPALSLPPVPGVGPVGTLLESEAARLFVARGRAQRPNLAVTEENSWAIAFICRQLEGIPLALELAAARAGVLSVRQIAARLGESFGLLTGGGLHAGGSRGGVQRRGISRSGGA